MIKLRFLAKEKPQSNINNPVEVYDEANTTDGCFNCFYGLVITSHGL